MDCCVNTFPRTLTATFTDAGGCPGLDGEEIALTWDGSGWAGARLLPCGDHWTLRFYCIGTPGSGCTLFRLDTTVDPATCTATILNGLTDGLLRHLTNYWLEEIPNDSRQVRVQIIKRDAAGQIESVVTLPIRDLDKDFPLIVLDRDEVDAAFATQARRPAQVI